MNTTKQTPIPRWLIPYSKDWHRLIEHNQRMGMTEQQAFADVIERRTAYDLQQARKVGISNG